MVNVKNLSNILLCLSMFWSSHAMAQRVGDFCMQAAWGQPNSLQCTVSDIQFVEVVDLNIIEDCASGEFQSASVEVQVEVSVTSDFRWDVGLFIALDGPDAVNGDLCLHDFLAVPGSGWFDFDGEACGDVAQGAFHKTLELEFVCQDLNQNGTVEVAYCTSGRVEGSNQLCTSVAGAIPDSPSRCHCDLLELPMPPAYLSFSNVAAPPVVVAGDPVSFTITAQSAGVEALTNVELADPDCDTLSPATGDDGDDVIGTGETWSWTCTVDAVTADLVNEAALAATTLESQMPVAYLAYAEVNVVDEVFDDGFETPDP